MAETTNTSQQLPAKPTFGFYVGLLNSMKHESAVSEVWREVRKQGAEDFAMKREAMLAAASIPQREPADRLLFYLKKPQEVWQELYAKFPNEYQHDWDDFIRLQKRAVDGDFTPEIAALTLLYQADRRREAVEQQLTGLFNG